MTDEIKVKFSFGENFNGNISNTFKHSDIRVVVLGILCSHRTWALHSPLVNHERLDIPDYSRGKCKAIGLAAKAELELGHATGQ